MKPTDPAPKPAPPSSQAERQARLAQALRDNLRRRKATAKDEPPPPEGD